MIKFMNYKLMYQIIVFILTIQTISTCPSEPYCTSCKMYNHRQICAKCTYSLYDPNSRHCRVLDIPIPNCAEYKDDGKRCQFCDYNYTLTKEGKCKQCEIENCAICNDDSSKCQACFNGLIVSNNSCKSSKAQKCLKTNCDICDNNNELCYRCNPGFSLDDKLECVEGFKGCSILAPNGEECMVCEYGYYITRTKQCVLNNTVDIFHTIMMVVGICFILSVLIVFLLCRWRNKKNKDKNNESINTEQDYYVPVY